MAVVKPEVVVSRFNDEITTRFQRRTPYFWTRGRFLNWGIFLLLKFIDSVKAEYNNFSEFLLLFSSRLSVNLVCFIQKFEILTYMHATIHWCKLNYPQVSNLSSLYALCRTDYQTTTIMISLRIKKRWKWVNCITWREMRWQ